MTTVLVNVGGAVAIALIVWWFWLTRPAARRVENAVIDVLVADGVYTPARIETVAGQPLLLRFLRKDPSPCAERVIFDELGVSAELPLNQTRELRVTPPRPGDYLFTCQMRMYRGTLVVK